MKPISVIFPVCVLIATLLFMLSPVMSLPAAADSPPTVQIVGYANTVDETGGVARLRVFLSAAAGLPVSVDYAVSGGTASSGGVDYTLNSGTLVFAPGETSRDIEIAIIDDMLAETNETVEVSISNPVNAVLGAMSMWPYLIVDDDSPVTVTYESYNPAGGTSTNPWISLAPGSYEAQTFLTHTNHNVTSLAVKVYRGYNSGGNVIVSLRRTSGGLPVGDDLGSGTFAVLSATSSSDGGWIEVPLATAVNLDAETVYAVVVFYQGNIYYPGYFYWFITPIGQAGYEDGSRSTSTDGTNWSSGTTDHSFAVRGNSNDPPRAAFSSAGAWGYEHNSINIPVILSTVSSVKVRVDYTVSGTATGSGVDYTLENGTLVFNPGQTSQNIIPIIIQDEVDDPGETIVVTLTNPLNADLGALSSFIYTIDPAQIYVSGAEVTEGNNGTINAAFQVTLNPHSTTATVMVDYATSDILAEAGSDYTTASGTLSFAPGENSKTINVSVNGDAFSEADETFLLSLSNPVNCQLMIDRAPGKIINDDGTPPLAGFLSAASSGPENNPAVLSVILSEASALPVSLDYFVSGGTASGGGADYTLNNGTLEFTAGQTSQDIVFSLTSDALNDSGETIVVSLKNMVNAVPGVNNTHTFTIRDSMESGTLVYESYLDDSPFPGHSPSNSIYLAGQTFYPTVSHNATSVFIKGYRDSGYSGYISVSIHETSGGLPSGPALCTGTFWANAVTGAEAGEWIEIGLSPIVVLDKNAYYAIVLKPEPDAGSTGNFHWLSTPYQKSSYSSGNSCTSIDGGQTWSSHSDYDFFFKVMGYYNDPPEVQVFGYQNTVNETDSSAAFRVILSGISSLPVSVEYTANNGTAISGLDFITSSGTLTFEPGETSLDFSVAIIDDELMESDENFELSISNPVNAVLGTSISWPYLIVDDDSPVTVTYESYNPAGGTSTNPWISLAPGSYEAQTFLTHTNHNVTSLAVKVYRGYNSGGNVIVSLRRTSGGLPVGDDLGSGTFAVLSATSSSDGGWIEVPLATAVNLDAETVYAVVVFYQGNIYYPGYFYWFITPIGQAGYEDGSRSTSSDGTNWSSGTTDHSFAVRGNSNGPPSVSFGAAPDSGSEEYSASLPVCLSSVSSLKVKVSYSVSGTATGSGVDYTLDSGTLLFTPGQTMQNIVIEVTDDNLFEDNETVAVTLTNPTNGVLGEAVSQVYTILDNDRLPLISINDIELYEGDAGDTAFIFTVSLDSPAPSGGAAFDIATMNQTAASPFDFTPRSLSGQIIPEGSTEYTFRVDVNGDKLFEDNETFGVWLSSVSGAQPGNLEGLGLIKNDDNLPDLTIIQTVSPQRVFPGCDLIFTLIVNNKGSTESAAFSVRDNLPGMVTLRTAEAGSGSFNPATGIWTVSPLQAGASTYLRLTVRVNPEAAPGDFINNSASIIWDYTDPPLVIGTASGSTSVQERHQVPGLGVPGIGLLVILFGILFLMAVKRRLGVKNPSG